MGCDMVTALGRATADNHTLFGHRVEPGPRPTPGPRLTAGRPHEPGERIATRFLELPQVRQSYTVLGCSTGGWGYQHGVNEHGLAVGRTPLRTRLTCPRPGLTGDELVRLTLERGRTARQAIDLLTDFIRRHGQGAFEGAPGDVEDSAFLIADATEAFAVEAAGPYYVWQQVREQRVLGPLGTVRQDWDWISPGLSERILGEGWWPEDGSKIDFAGCVCPPLAGQRDAARRWGRRMMMLGEQSGHIDVAFLRRLLVGVEDEDADADSPALVVELRQGEHRPIIAWTAVGSGRLSVFFPLLLQGELPAAFVEEAAAGLPSPHATFAPTTESEEGVRRRLGRLRDRLGTDEEAWDRARDALDRLQARFDQEADEFATEAARLSGDEVRRQATFFMQHCVERFEEVADGLAGRPRDPSRPTAFAGRGADLHYMFEG